jgi:hypothetical protein
MKWWQGNIRSIRVYTYFVFNSTIRTNSTISTNITNGIISTNITNRFFLNLLFYYTHLLVL